MTIALIMKIYNEAKLRSDRGFRPDINQISASLGVVFNLEGLLLGLLVIEKNTKTNALKFNPILPITARSVIVIINMVKKYEAERDNDKYYMLFRPALCKDLIRQNNNELITTNQELGEKHNCSETTVRNCRRAIL